MFDATQYLFRTAVGNEVRSDLEREIRYSREEPGGRGPDAAAS